MGLERQTVTRPAPCTALSAAWSVVEIKPTAGSPEIKQGLKEVKSRENLLASFLFCIF